MPALLAVILRSVEGLELMVACWRKQRACVYRRSRVLIMCRLSPDVRCSGHCTIHVLCIRSVRGTSETIEVYPSDTNRSRAQLEREREMLSFKSTVHETLDGQISALNSQLQGGNAIRFLSPFISRFSCSGMATEAEQRLYEERVQVGLWSTNRSD